MKFGCCTSLDNVGIVEKIGYDYIELPVGSVKPEEKEEEFERIRKKLEKFDLKMEAFNTFVPPDLKIIGSETDFARLHRYVKIAFRRVNKLGGKVVVFGSGKAREIPDEFSRRKAIKQIKDFLNMVSEEATQNNLLVAIEPLRRAETNIIHQVEEAYKLSLEVSQVPIKVLADFYHMEEEGEPLSHLVTAREKLGHIHVADTERKYPGSGNYDYQTFFENLKKANYNSRISCECRWDNFIQEASKALYFLKNMWNKVTFSSSTRGGAYGGNFSEIF